MLPDSGHCCGCGACYSACPRGAIRMTADSEGFLQPVVDPSSCVSCLRCEKVCPVLNKGESRLPLSAFAARAKDDDVRKASSSGGVFPLLARECIHRGGVVFGAAMEMETLSVVHVGIDKEDQLPLLQGSKYVQSAIGDSFKGVSRYLEQGRFVLFSGTPCQVAGLKSFLGARATSDRLLCVEVFCHAVPSPKVLRGYLEEVSRRRRHKVRAIRFRDKSTGWADYSTSIVLDDGRIVSRPHSKEPYSQIFSSDIPNRRSCYHCPCREMRSGADISIGDFWGIWDYYPEFNDNMGTSAVLVNSAKGKDWWSALDVDAIPATYGQVRAGNRSLHEDPLPDIRRKRFFELLNRGVPLSAISRRMLYKPLPLRILNSIGRRIVHLFR